MLLVGDMTRFVEKKLEIANDCDWLGWLVIGGDMANLDNSLGKIRVFGIGLGESKSPYLLGTSKMNFCDIYYLPMILFKLMIFEFEWIINYNYQNLLEKQMVLDQVAALARAKTKLVEWKN